jgi:Tfp pilus assembly protein PilO
VSASNRLVVSILVVAAAAVAFWMLALGPKREQASELESKVTRLQASLTEAQSRVGEAETARREFPADYRQLVVLGQAVPPSDETSSLLVELQHIAARAKVRFSSIQLATTGGEETPAAAAPPPSTTTPGAPETPSEGSASAVPASATVPPTEAAASVLPLGARIGPAGLDVMPYDLKFSGSFFHVADFMHEVDALVHTTNSTVNVDGRLMTLDGFSLSGNAEHGFPYLDATFSVTTYLTPPSQGLTAGASPEAPAPSTAAPASETSTETGTSSETVAAR